MRTILILMLAFGMNAQGPQGRPRPMADFATKHNDAVHFYASCLTNDIFYSTQGLIWKEWKPSRKLIISNAMTLATISAKECYDMRKRNPTGWSWDDFFIGVWAMLIYVLARICINDYRKYKYEQKNRPSETNP